MLLSEEDIRRYLDCRFRTQLNRMGVPRDCEGYEYLTLALNIAWDRGAIDTILSRDELFGAIADECGISASNVEKCMRAALDAAWEKNHKAISHELYTDRKPGIQRFIIQNLCVVRYLCSTTS